MQADLIVTAPTIHTVDPNVPVAQGIAVRAGRFIFAGSRDEALALRGPTTELLDFPEATILPGLIDAHVHLANVGRELHEVDLFNLTSYEEIVLKTAAFAKTSPDTWIMGDGWDQNLWPVTSFPTHAALSAAIPDRPVLLKRVDSHALLLNAKAIAAAGITNATADPPGGRILRDSSGEPTGVFVDNALDLIYRVVPEATHEQLVRWTRAGCAEANRFGVTAIGDANTSGAALAAYEELGRAGELSLRIHTMLFHDPVLLGTHLANGPIDGAHDGRLSIRAIKMFADGALGSRGAALLQPYSDDPANSGLTLVTQDRIAEVTARALVHGFQMCVHAIGDRGNRIALDAFETALRTVGPGDYRLRIEHAQVLSPQDIPRFRELGVIPSMQTAHQNNDAAWVEARLGPERTRGAYAWRALLDTGVAIANGTDAPVAPMNASRTFHAAISPAGGWHPQQKMTRDEALKSMTIWAAHANFAENAIGSIAPGKYADFVVMDRDWLLAPDDTILHTRILATYSSGRCVYEATDA